MLFSLLDLQMNVTYDVMNFTHLTWLMLLYTTLWKSKHRKCMRTQLQVLILTTK